MNTHRNNLKERRASRILNINERPRKELRNGSSQVEISCTEPFQSSPRKARGNASNKNRETHIIISSNSAMQTEQGEENENVRSTVNNIPPASAREDQLNSTSDITATDPINVLYEENENYQISPLLNVPPRSTSSTSSTKSQRDPHHVSDQSANRDRHLNPNPSISTPMKARVSRPVSSLQHRRILTVRNKSSSDPPQISSMHPEVSTAEGSTPGTASNFESAFNNCKAELRDAKRDKRVFVSFYEAEKAKNVELENERAHLAQRVAAMEILLAKKGKRFRKDGNNRSRSGSKSTAREKYYGVFISLLHDINSSANLCVTESYYQEAGGVRVRNWSNSVTKVSPQTAKDAGLFVFVPCGTHAIPQCPMELALKREFYTLPYENITAYIHHRTKLLLQGGRFDYMSATMRDDCVNVAIADAELISRHKHSLSETMSQRKKHAKLAYLKALGYEYVYKPVPGKGEDLYENQRREERAQVHRLCVLKEDGVLDTMFWRISELDDLFNPCPTTTRIIAEMRSADVNANSNGNVDLLFSNHAAHLAFNEFKGYERPPNGFQVCNDSSILTLARADAWMTTMLEHILLEGKGGKRNNQFTDCFQKLIPVALESIIEELWNDIKGKAPDELLPRLGIGEENESDPYGNTLRDHTVVHHSPRDKCLYLALALTSNYFKGHICSWYGNVKDCFIGRCNNIEDHFKRIECNTNFGMNMLASDIDSGADVERLN